MANEQNLVSLADRTTEEKREIGIKGGKASGKVRREKKKMREQAELLLSLPLKDKKTKEHLKKLGINVSEMNNQMAIIIAMWQKALKGDVSAASWLRDLLGEKPIEKVEMSGEVNNPFKDLSTEELRELIGSE